MATTPLTSNTHGEGHHVTPPKKYWEVLFYLAVLMAATIFVAVKVQVPDIGPIPGVWLNNLIALGIAVAKALLVIWFFMGVKHASGLTRIWVVAGFLCFSFMFFILADNFTRVYEPAPGWVKDREDDTSAYPRTITPLEEKLPDPSEVNVRPRQ